MDQDHIDWLLAAAYNYLAQHNPDRAAVLLELARLFDPDNLQCRKMLACAWVEDGQMERALPLLEELQNEPLGADDRSAMYLLQLAGVRRTGTPQEYRNLSEQFRAHMTGRQASTNGRAQ